MWYKINQNGSTCINLSQDESARLNRVAAEFASSRWNSRMRMKVCFLHFAEAEQNALRKR
jgi:microcystin degradation protein MlrC